MWRCRNLVEHGDPYVNRASSARIDELSSWIVTRHGEVVELAIAHEEHAPGVRQR
jgi:hypothetical protein